jgi:hypothetical protein
MGEGDVVVAALVMPDEEDLERGMDERKGTMA